LGWVDGRNVSLDVRWAAGDATAFPDTRRELVALAPDVIVAPTSTMTDAPLLYNPHVPIVF
jgi:putative ABC transport system substrate-binding protein